MDSPKGRKVARPALGRGLSALISSTPVAVNDYREGRIDPVSEGQILSKTVTAGTIEPSNQDGGVKISMLPIGQVERNPKQPRQVFNDNEIRELCESIKTLGVLQPVLVRSISANIIEQRYEIIAGERRWRAARLAKLTHIPAVVHEIDDAHALELALVENVQRENLNPIEEARGYQRLMQEFNLSQQEVAERVGKDRTTVSNAVRILKLPDEIQEMIFKDTLSLGHAKALLSIREESGQISLARKVVREGLSVRALEHLVQQVVVLDVGRRGQGQIKGSRATEENNGNGVATEIIDRMRQALGTKVAIKHHESGRGRIEIEYFSEAELDRIIDKICGSH